MSFKFFKKIIKVNKIFKNSKNLNSISYKSFVIIGDKNGGLGFGKSISSNQNLSISKALFKAKCNFFKVFINKDTILYRIIGKCCNCKVILTPLSYMNFSSGGVVRSILDIMGIYKISSKIYGSGNFYNIIIATINALKSFDSINFINNKCL